MSKKFQNIAFIVLVVITVSLAWMYSLARNDAQELSAQVNELESSMAVQQNFTQSVLPPSSGNVDISAWKVVENPEYHFSVRYPQGWSVNTEKNVPTPTSTEQASEVPALSLTISSNTEIADTWQAITLSNGSTAYYSFDGGFDHYYMVSGDAMLLWTIPARSQGADNMLQEATQIVNTYQAI
ncbi:MAG: hypothetical protein H6760_03385 [Candidatus Nomurabacteria bacterium]|nr:MAG: hypothetical protein H6760_03385 [Candidatus Nomurabacteria bacterium]